MNRLEYASRMRDMVLVVDDEPATRTGVAAAVGATGRSVVTCGDVESAQLVIERLPVASVFTDMHMSGPFSDDGLKFIDFVTRRAPQSRVVLMTACSSPALRREAEARGAVAVLEKPFTSDDVESILRPSRSASADDPSIIDVPGIEQVLSGTSLYSVFQPIVAIDRTDTPAVAYEALSRVETDGPLHAPDFLFEYSVRKRRTADVELRCVENGVREGALLPNEPAVFINVHPTVLADRRIVDGFTSAATRHGVSPERLVIEITEQSAMCEVAATLANIEALSDCGFRFAFDDVGIVYSHLLHLERVRPAFMKISHEFGSEFHRHDAKTKIVRNIVSLAGDFGCEVVLEGVESAETIVAARALGIRYVQGFLFGRPARAGEWAGRKTA